MKHIIFIILFASFFTNAFAQDPPLMVREVQIADVHNFTMFQGELYFAKHDSIITVTPGSTGSAVFADLDQEVMEMGVNTSYSYERVIRFPKTLDHIFFITASGTTPSYNLWWSNGAPESTEIIFSADTMFQFTTFNNTMYFIAEQADLGRELFRVGATGEVLVMTDIMPSTGHSFPERAEIAAADNYLYFTAQDAEHGIELWQSAGAQFDATLVEDLSQGTDNTEFRDMVMVGTDLYFTKTQFFGPDTLFTYDGTSVTMLSAREYDVIVALASFNNNSVLFTLSAPGSSGSTADLYITQGVPGDTVHLGEFPSNLSYFIPVGDQMFFARHVDGNPFEIYRTDGTPGGTNVFNGSFAAGEVNHREWAQINNLVFFTEFETDGWQLAQTNLTTEGTATVQEITGSTETYGNAFNLTEADGALFFTAESQNDVYTLYYYGPDVVTSTFSPVADASNFSIYPNPASSDLNIKVEKAGMITIVNNVSQVVLQEQVTDQSLLSINHLPAGMYFVQYSSEGKETSVKKLIKK